MLLLSVQEERGSGKGLRPRIFKRQSSSPQPRSLCPEVAAPAAARGGLLLPTGAPRTAAYAAIAAYLSDKGWLPLKKSHKERGAPKRSDGQL